MATKRWILFLLAAAMISLLAGCGGSTANVQNPPPPPQSQANIAFQPEPGSSLAVSFSENVTAAVTNDPTNAGVTWNLVCPPGASPCGTLSAAHTASGAPTTFTAPSTISTNTLTVEIVAYATANQSANVVAPVTITTFNSSLQAGTYVLQAQGVDINLNPYQFAAAIVLDGQGNIKNGEQTANYASTGSLSDSNLTGSYFLGSDGRGMITINTSDNKIGQNGVETFSFVYLSGSQALISQMDLGIAATGASAQGTLNLQTSTTAPTGGYAFVVNGTDTVAPAPVAFGGVFNIDSPNTISGNGSVTDEILAKKVTATAATLSGTLTTPDQFGGFTLSLTAPFGKGKKNIPLQFMGYIVDATNIQLIETDTAAGNASPFALTSGPAIGQGAATGTFTGNTSFSGTFVFGITGVDLSNSNIVSATLTSVSLLTADGSGNLSNGFTDTFLDLNTSQGTVSNPQTGSQISAAFNGTYSVDSSGTGRASLTLSNFNPDPKHGYQPVLFSYLTGTGNENTPLVLEGGDTPYPSLGAGIAYPQSTETAAFNGDYGFSFTQELSGSSENDGTAQLNANSTTVPPSLSGLADINVSASANQDQPFTGTFSAPTATGPFAGILIGTNNNVVSSVAFTPQIAVDYYFIDPSHGFFVETDLVTEGAQQNGQVSIGYYAARTPVCTGCP